MTWHEMSYNLYKPKSAKYRLIYEIDEDLQWLEKYKLTEDEESEGGTSVR